jgi:hypothetical protein
VADLHGQPFRFNQSGAKSLNLVRVDIDSQKKIREAEGRVEWTGQ